MIVFLLILCSIISVISAFVDVELVKLLTEIVSLGATPGNESQTIRYLILLAFGVLIIKLLNIILIVLTARRLSVHYVSLAVENIISSASPIEKIEFSGIMENSNHIQTFVLSMLQFISSSATVLIIIYLTLDFIDIKIPSIIYIAIAAYILFNLLVRKLQSLLGDRLAELANKRFKPFADVVNGSYGIKISKLNLFYKSFIKGIEGKLRLTQGSIFILATSPKLFLDLLIVLIIVVIVSLGNGTQILAALAFVALRVIPLITAAFLALAKISAYWTPVMKVFEFSKNTSNSLANESGILLKNNIIVIGPSGSGKSTLLKNILENKLTENARILDSIDKTNKMISNGIFMQRSYDLSITLKKFKERASFNINIFDKFLLNKIDDSILLKSLSGGELQRLWLSVAIRDEFTQYFLDEPTNNLDINSKKIFLSWMSGTTKKIFIVTHDNEVIDICKKLNYKIIDLS